MRWEEFDAQSQRELSMRKNDSIVLLENRFKHSIVRIREEPTPNADDAGLGI